jgi:hypothetical protein
MKEMKMQLSDNSNSKISKRDIADESYINENVIRLDSPRVKVVSKISQKLKYILESPKASKVSTNVNSFEEFEIDEKNLNIKVIIIRNLLKNLMILKMYIN